MQMVRLDEATHSWKMVYKLFVYNHLSRQKMFW